VSQDCLKRYLYRHKEDSSSSGRPKIQPETFLCPQKHLKTSSDLIVPCFFEPLRRALSSENSVAQSGWAERCESALRSALESFLEARQVDGCHWWLVGGFKIFKQMLRFNMLKNHTWQG